jgi:hydrogenase maturation protein HypF
MIMRNARGFAPFSIKKNIKPNLLGVGANQKNSIAISLKGKVILSPHIGDLNTLESVEFFERTIETLRRIYDFEEDIIVCDKHPLYESTKWALSQNKEVIQIQHHYAHALATMFEYNLDGDYLVFAFDGTGYGDDGTIWGGEVFIANRKTYKRVHYIKPFSLIGGEKAIKNPANFAVSLIDEDLAKNFSNYKIVKALKNAPFIKTSSMGRVFDAVAFLGGLIDKNYYEGFSGLRIEKFYSSKEFIDIKIEKEICLKEIFNFAARNRGNFERVSSVFINSIVNMIVKIINLYNLPVIVTGGVFQNKTLLRELLKRKRVYFSKKIPLNDGGISIGQIFFV